MKKIFICVALFSVSATLTAQNIGINTDGTAAETGVMLDVKGTTPVATTAALQNIFQVKSFNADATALKLRLGLKTDATASLRYGLIDVYDAGSAAYRHLALQPLGGNVGIGTITPRTTMDVNGSFAFRDGGSLALANGANNNISLGTSPYYSFYRITGPTAAFSISGIVPPTSCDGMILTVYNTTSQAMTIVNNATSTAANQILTLTGVNITTPAGPNAVSLQYNLTSQRWLLIGGQNLTTASSGALNGVQVFTANGTYVPTAGTTRIFVEIIGGGGGGGGGTAQNFGVQGCASGGGGSGAYTAKYISTVATAGNTIVIGSGGVTGTDDGVAGTRNGVAGGTSSFLDANTATTYTALGGSGGAGFDMATQPNPQGGYTTLPKIWVGGAGGAAAGTGDIKCAGSPGGPGIMLGTTAGTGVAGQGGSSHYGGGALGPVTLNATYGGYQGGNYGNGGSGSIGIGLGSGTPAGGRASGSSGVVIVWEYK